MLNKYTYLHCLAYIYKMYFIQKTFGGLQESVSIGIEMICNMR